MSQVATDKSLNQSMGNAQKHYSSLFFLPRFKVAVALVAVVCIGVVGLSTFALFRSLDWLAYSLLLGGALFGINLLFDFVLSRLVLARDPVFVTRRTVALSFYCWVLWLPFIILGVIAGFEFGWWIWIKLCLLGFCSVLTLRAVVFFSVSSARSLLAAVASLLQPVACIVPFVFFWARVDTTIPLQTLPFIVVTPFLCLASAFLFVSLIDRQGRRTYGVPSMPLFKAFMLNWVADLKEPIEGFLEKLGEGADVEVSLLKFDASKPVAAIIVPLVHPGPFKDIGSSLLPFLLKRDFERAFRCHACVPLGIMGHELDLTSQKENQRVIDSAIASAKFEATIVEASPFIRVTDGSATASCQVFGDAALLSFTLAPKTTEDLPQELGRIVRAEAEKRGLSCTVVVNAHNSITDSAEMDESLDALQALAAKCLDKALSLRSEPFEVGAATVFPTEFSLKDGMGAGGITAIVVKVAAQKTAYVVIDGNNMISGLREEVLSALAAKGFDKSEVFTTDTHAVSAVILGKRGYHPVGEAMNHEALFRHIKEAALTAASRLEPCKAGCLSFIVPRVRVIGKSRIHSLTTLVDTALQRAKQIVIPVFALEGLLVVLFLAVL